MNARIYLRLLHPKGSLVFGGIYAFAGFFMTNGFLGSARSWDESKFLTSILVLPLLIGYIIASTAHEQLHRPTALLLPDLHRRMARATLIALAVAAALLTLMVSLSAPAVPPPATFGLAVALLTVCFPNRYRYFMGMPWIFGLTALWTFFVATSGPSLRPALITFPWIFFVIGLGVAALNLTLLFGRRYRRERATSPYFSFVPIHVLNPQVSQRLQFQQSAKDRPDQASRVSANANWPVRRVTGSVSSWMEVFWHAGIGGLPGRSFWQVQLVVFTAMMLIALAVSFLIHVGELTAHGQHAFSFSNYWIALSDFIDPWSRLRAAQGHHPSMVALCAVFGMMMSATMFVLITPLPRLSYPVSRLFVSRAVFALCVRQLTGTMLVSVSVIVAVGTIGQIGAGKFLPATAYGNLACATLLLAAFLPLFLCGQFFRSRKLAFVWSVMGMFVLITAVLIPTFLPGGWLLAGGIPIILVGCAVSYALLWWNIRRYYLRSDLVTETGFIKSLVQVRIDN